MFYASLLKGQTMILNMFVVPFCMARVFGTVLFFDEQETGLAAIDLVLVTKTSETA